MTAAGSFWSDYVDLPEVQFFIHHWPVYLVIFGVVGFIVWWSNR